MDTLAALRREIDALDDGILELLAQRMAVARRVAAYKHEAGIPARLADRIEATLRSALPHTTIVAITHRDGASAGRRHLTLNPGALSTAG